MRENPSGRDHILKGRKWSLQARSARDAALKIEALFKAAANYDNAAEDGELSFSSRKEASRLSNQLNREAKQLLSGLSVRSNPLEEEKELLLFSDPSVGDKMHNWHSGMGDVIYRVGSLIYSGHPVSSADVEDAIGRFEDLRETADSYEDVGEIDEILDELNAAVMGLEDDL